MSATYHVECPKCGAGAGEPCRALKSGRVTDTHTSRMDAESRWRRQRRLMGVESEEDGR